MHRGRNAMDEFLRKIPEWCWLAAVILYVGYALEKKLGVIVELLSEIQDHLTGEDSESVI
jgi:hypothetical protein